MKTTTNLGFKKPEASDFISPDAFNDNMDALDAMLPKKADLNDDGKIPSSQVPSAATESALSGASTKDAPADTDSLVLVDSEASGATKRILWSKFKDVLSNVFASKSHTHVKANITDFPSTMPPSAHTQAASTITAGTFAGKVRANASAMSTLNTPQLRDIVFTNTDPGTGASRSEPDGTLIAVYE